MKRGSQVVAIAAAAALTLAGCESWNRTAKGGAIGAGAGGAVGALIGHATGSTVRGAIIGAAVGGIAGGMIGRQMDKQAAELEQNIKGAKVERVGEGIQVTFESGLLYDFDSDVVKPDARTNLRELAVSLDKYPNSDLVIIGHTDQVGSAEYNQQLSERRASAAARYLVSQGVSGSRVATRGLGETEPVQTNDTETGRAANRRVEVAIFASKEYREKVARTGEP